MTNKTNEKANGVSPLEYLNQIEFREPQQIYKNIVAFPLFTESDGLLLYGMLDEALREGSITVSEVSKGGSVPDLMVKNDADIPVLILSGEELKGAKQNRVLNTSILLDAHSETKVPVSCTEAGRWSYTSQTFGSSGYAAPSGLRVAGLSYCSASLRDSGGASYASNQGGVWEGIRGYSNRANVNSRTSAMEDVYTSRESQLKEALDAIPLVPGQKGILVFINGEVVGFDLLSRSDAYKVVHEKLVKSYTMDAILGGSNVNITPTLDAARAFIEQAKQCSENKYKSTGLGSDHRYTGTNIAGLSLVHEDTPVHTAFFRTGASTQEHQQQTETSSSRMASYTQRMRL